MGVRFAPSPTGAFHVGNFRTAWISREWARALSLPWVLRFEDIDGPRVVAGAQEAQLADMRRLGLVADEVRVQSEYHHRHVALFERAVAEGAVYPCLCSRKEVLAGMASAPHRPEAVYTGHCRPADPRARARVPEGFAQPGIGWRFRGAAEDGSEDFIIARTSPRLDGAGRPDLSTFVPSYHWACAIDDYDGGYALLVRAFDLRDAAVQQRAIQEWVARTAGAPVKFPAVFHTALVVSNDGHRLEKRTRGVTLVELEASGVTPEKLRELFARSFELKREEFGPGRLFGETRDRITLAEFGL